MTLMTRLAAVIDGEAIIGLERRGDDVKTAGEIVSVTVIGEAALVALTVISPGHRGAVDLDGEARIGRARAVAANIADEIRGEARGNERIGGAQIDDGLVSLSGLTEVEVIMAAL